MNLVINGGEGATQRLATKFGRLTQLPAYAASVWLNDVFLKTSYGKCVQLPVLLNGLLTIFSSSNNNNVVDETDLVYELPEDVLRVGEDNVITVVQDNMGLDETGENPETGEGTSVENSEERG